MAAELSSVQAEVIDGVCEKKLTELISRLSLAELPDAVSYLNAHETSTLGRDLLSGLIRKWAAGDPRGADCWAMDLSAGPVREEAWNDSRSFGLKLQ